ncbi:4-hydroxyphenylacetate 3-hydroxylase C-terminal domain-containing protein [Polycladomyces subterraneus]|uniref:4-hydroxyphenylacetate 3-hydroxylase C-terminal domain-containing protein n=1 Tax=Polycladomyces subterraneus TaxID=1016997 RepID=UPI00263B7F36|nr:4-hydroxyphenylacetate 3-hydroxylase C-terminal domain-containing protein [Polycladomyces subterraneus]
MEKLYRGSNGIDAESKMKVIKLLWDAIGSEYGGRHELYERNYAGNHEKVRLENLRSAWFNGQADEFEEFTEQCLSEYDLNCWTDPTWINPTDVSRVKG